MAMITPPPDTPSAGVVQASADEGGVLTAIEAAELGLTPAQKPRSKIGRAHV